MKSQEEILREVLKKKSIQELVDMYNIGTGKKIKKFSKKQVDIDKIVGLMLKRTVENPIEQVKKSVTNLLHDHGDLCNADFAKLDTFKSYCKKADIEPTKRQTSKFRRQKGLAYAVA